MKSIRFDDTWILSHEPVDPESTVKVSGAVKALGHRWTWDRGTVAGVKPETTSGVTLAYSRGRAWSFGGVIDEEDDESLQGTFLDDFYSIALDKDRPTWFVGRGYRRLTCDAAVCTARGSLRQQHVLRTLSRAKACLRVSSRQARSTAAVRKHALIRYQLTRRNTPIMCCNAHRFAQVRS